MNWIELGYLGLFLVCFLAATVIPIASEAVLLGMLALGYHPMGCLVVATVGNSLGSYLNFGIGYIGKPEWLKKLRVKQVAIDKWKLSIQKHGSLLALLSWLPVRGDVIGIALGFFKANVFGTFVFMLIGKFVRYLVVVLIYLYY